MTKQFISWNQITVCKKYYYMKIIVLNHVIIISFSI